MSARPAISAEIFVGGSQTPVPTGVPHVLTVSASPANGRVGVLQLCRFGADRYFGQYRVSRYRNLGPVGEAMESEFVDAASIDATLAETKSGLLD